MLGIGIRRHLCSMGGTATARSGGISSAVAPSCASRCHLADVLCRFGRFAVLPRMIVSPFAVAVFLTK